MAAATATATATPSPVDALEICRERFYYQARQAGCPEEQAKNFWRAGVILQPKQLQFSAAARACDVRGGPTEIGFGGARGGGKSHVMMAQMGADDCQRRPGLKCLLLRRVGKANLEHFSELRMRVFNGLPHHYSKKGILEFANGSKIIAGHFQKDTDIDSYLGLEYDVIAVEEATTLTHQKYKEISTCLRTSKQDWRPRMYSTTNPGGIGHGWYKTRFILPFKANRQIDTRFVPSRVEDNQYNNEGYVRVLEGLTGWQRRAWRFGDWDIAAGQFFTTFRLEHHVPEWMNSFDERKLVSWRGALDYGFTHYTVCLIGGRDGDGRTFIMDEHARQQWVPDRHAPAIKAMVGRHARWIGDRRLPLDVGDLGQIVAGTDVFGTESDGQTVAKQYDKLEIRLKAANTDRVNGWAEILKLLGDPDGDPTIPDSKVPPRLFIHPRCTKLIETLPLMQHDPNHPEDVLKVDVDEDGAGGDDAPDALRYYVASVPHVIEQRKMRFA